MSSFEDRVGAVVQGILADQMNWPPEMISAIPQLVAQSPAAAARVPGDLIASGLATSNVTTTGTTFATGADILATPLTFTAQGSNDYLLVVSSESWHNSGTNQQFIRINLDGADYGAFALYNSAGAGFESPINVSGVMVRPTAGSHTVNARLITGGGTATIVGTAGGVAGGGTPILVALYKI